MSIYQIILGATTLLLLYVLARFVPTVLQAGRQQRRQGTAGVVFGVGVPVAFAMSPVGSGIREEDLPMFVLGSLIWVTLMFAFAAYSASRVGGVRIS